METSQEQQAQRAHALDMALRTPDVRDASHALKVATAYQSYIASGDPAVHKNKPDAAAAQSAAAVSEWTSVGGTINKQAITIRDLQGKEILGAVLTLPAQRPRLD